MRNFERNIFPILILVLIFYDPLFFAYTSTMGITVESGMKKYEAIAIAMAVYPIFFMDMFRQKTSKALMNVFFVILLLLTLYWGTSVFHTQIPRLYMSQVLVFGAICIPSTYMGTRLARSDCFERINVFLPFFTIPLAIIFSRVGFSAAAENSMLGKEESGLTYQNISYFFAFLYAYNLYYLFFSNVKNTRLYRIMRLPVLIAIVLCFVGCLTGGGRGAFAFMICVTAYIIYDLYNSGKINPDYLSYFIIATIILFIILANFIDITGSAGYSRITHKLFVDENRRELWTKAMNAFSDSPIWGHGLGSIWWTVGYYSHNIFTDLLAETGVIGTLIGVCILWKVTSYLYYLIKNEQKYVLIMIVFLSGMITSLFSGYWFTMGSLFLVTAFAYVHKKEKVYM